MRCAMSNIAHWMRLHFLVFLIALFDLGFFSNAFRWRMWVPRGRSHLPVSIGFGVTREDLSNENLVKIVNLVMTDEECNALCWKCLGYSYNATSQTFSNENVFLKWRSRFPEPPDVIGVTRNYTVAVDKPVRDASIALVRSIPRNYKGSVMSLTNAGFTGFKINEMTPNKTRRAQLVSWLLYYRDCLHGKSLEELEAAQRARAAASSVGEVMQRENELPSERHFQNARLD